MEDTVRTSTKGVLAAVAAAALAVGTTGVVAASDDSGRPSASDSPGSVGASSGQSREGMGWRFSRDGASERQRGMQRGTGTCEEASAPVSSGPLTDQQGVDLADMAQEEKLAHDLYVAFAERYDDRRFDMIANAETRHLAAVRSVLDRYDIADPTQGMADGEFTSEQWQDTYDRLLSAGSAGLSAALDAAAWVERTDIADLQSAIAGLQASDVMQVYTNLLSGSQRHLQAFTR
jgi:hypothetical protein